VITNNLRAFLLALLVGGAWLLAAGCATTRIYQCPDRGLVVVEGRLVHPECRAVDGSER
jgi:hypothetical protein